MLQIVVTEVLLVEERGVDELVSVLLASNYLSDVLYRDLSAV